MKKQPEQSADELALGKIIARELREQLRGAESDCPETETLAAFYDRTLTDRERALWEKHFLGCLRCQEYLAELARLADADEPPTLLADDATKAAAEDSPGWFYRLAWVIPFLIIGIASVIWYRKEIKRYLPQPQQTAMNVPSPSPPAGLPQQEVAAKGEAGRPTGLKDLAKPSSAPTPASAATKAKTDLRRDSPSAALAREGQSTAGAGAMALPSERASVIDAAKTADKMLQAEVTEKKAPSSEYALPASAAPPSPPTAAAEADSSATRKESSRLGGLTIRGVQPKSAIKWRVGPKGTIQKADESGGWERVASGVQDDLFDITFAGEAGWAVGHEGTVLRSTDGGNTWRKVAAPTTEDLVRVSTLGAQQAQVFARSGKSYTTTDGGRTWK